MHKDLVEKIKNDPNYKELVSKRSSFSLKLTISMLVVYFAFILTIAFSPSLLGTPLSEGSVTTIGIPIGMAVIIFAFVITGIYTKRANGEFDDLNNKIKDAVKEH
ncbi:MAG: DUF485 domain-containing protein [Sulfurimonas sp.]|jgi:uncharacterized membrane protein (DUF485 family)|nr:DUF485 domain-containing protein [Sulfurimonas sp.]MBU3939986.1 DUF485 domain-containing protein [bacterium]MBU4024383.1 DUF485 domain-containing protein [bacterium]MBU4058571.1 DUF485 domain-containing protein [bacterium]MBU4110717.1 DUF485 domain-containing protein [bacterium]